VPLKDDPYVYIKGEGANTIYLIIHIDDFIITAPIIDQVNKVLADICSCFPAKDLGEPAKFLGCYIYRDYKNKTITLS
jgi:hypothetical protein